jgi:hypothetical protein
LISAVQDRNGQRVCQRSCLMLFSNIWAIIKIRWAGARFPNYILMAWRQINSAGNSGLRLILNLIR